MKLDAVADLPVRSVSGVWYRAVQRCYRTRALSYSHTRNYSSRYYPAHAATVLFDTLYLAETPEVATCETQGLWGSPLLPGGAVAKPASGYEMIQAEVKLTRVADLSTLAAHHRLHSNAQELTGDWRHYGLRTPADHVPEPSGIPAPTQELGVALHREGSFEGFLAISARQPTHWVLGVFPARIESGNFLRYSFMDETGQAQTMQIP